jgi:hypothetical protein
MAARIVGDGSPPLIVTGSDDDGSRDRGRWEFSVSDAGRQGDFVCFASGQPELLRYYRRAATAIRLVGCGDKRTAASQLRLDLGPGIPRMIVRQSHQPDKARNHDNHELAATRWQKMVKQDSHAYRHAIIEEPGNVVEKGQMSIWSVWGKRKCANSKMGLCKKPLRPVPGSPAVIHPNRGSPPVSLIRQPPGTAVELITVAEYLS